MPGRDSGESVNRAVRQRLFRPAVKDHHFIETTAEIPFSFPAPG
jgi:hypothetical protein